MPKRIVKSSSRLCPFCASANVRFAASTHRHRVRKLLGSRKRFCADCGRRWGKTVSPGPMTVLRPLSLPIILVFSVAAGILAAVIGSSSLPQSSGGFWSSLLPSIPSKDKLIEEFRRSHSGQKWR